jgi:acetyl coenzyme A synthetase (ADP forming)-like protein
MTEVRPLYIPAPYQDAAERGRIILRDGTTASVHIAGPEDREALRAFFQGLSSESRRRRFFSLSLPSAELIDSFCDCSAPQRNLSLVVSRISEGVSRVIATGSYQRVRDATAEVAFAVDDALRGKGLGTLLLERLAILAARHGFTHFWAVTHADNQGMIEVFRESGFQLSEKLEGGYLEVDLSVAPSETSVSRSEVRDRVATTASLRPFFQPRAVAVIGASRDPSSIGYRVVNALVSNHFQGPVYPVNPKAASIAGLPAYHSVRELPEPVDLAVLTVPRDAVLGVVDDCAAKGVRAVVVITANFAEVDAAGRELQQQLVEKVRGHGMRLIGPNCMGLINTDPRVQLNASFSPVFPPHGRVAMSSQSGALGLAILAAARRTHLGLSSFVSVGNKADVSGNDLLQYWEEDDATRVILLYLESFGNPRRFSRIARRVSLRKPILAIKAGRTAAGSRAASSHTAALAASDAAVKALFEQTGIIRAETLEEMFDLAAALGSQPLPRGRRVAIVTNAGGPAILCADACEAGGLAVPELSAQTKAPLAAVLPPAASLANPVDMIASARPEQYGQVIETVLSSGEVDSLIVIYIPVGLVETEAVAGAVLQGVGRAREAAGAEVPVLACLMGEDATRTQLARENERIPSYAFPEAAARVLCKTTTYSEWRQQPVGIVLDFGDIDFPASRAICRSALENHGSGWLSTEEARGLLNAARLPVLPGGVAKSAEQAAELASRIGFPVAVKLSSQRLIHKTELGGVCLNLPDESAVRRAYEQIQDRLRRDHNLDAMDGVLVQPMVAGGVEVMIGVTHDPQFGPLIAFGLGGIHVEILGDVCFRVTPLTDRDANEMVQSIRGYRLLQGYRGHCAADVDAIKNVLQRISRLVEEVPQIREVDLNPIIALGPGQGCHIVDARVRVEPN